jgi:hypothetical protein
MSLLGIIIIFLLMTLISTGDEVKETHRPRRSSGVCDESGKKSLAKHVVISIIIYINLHAQ